MLGALGAQQDPSGRYTPPHPDTIEWVFRAVGAPELTNHLGTYLGHQAGIGRVGAPLGAPTLLPALAIDGEAVRGAIRSDGQIPYLLGAATHTDSTAIAERLIGAKEDSNASILVDINKSKVVIEGRTRNNKVRRKVCARRVSELLLTGLVLAQGDVCIYLNGIAVAGATIPWVECSSLP